MAVFQIGTVVVLKSGSPPMTVSEIYSGQQEVKCVWFDSTGCIHDFRFHQDALKADGEGLEEAFDEIGDEEIPF